MRRASLVIVWLVLGFVVITRGMGAYDGLPYLYHWDEVITSSSALNILKTGDIRPRHVENVYGGFLRYSSVVLDAGYFLYLKLTGQIDSLKNIKTNLEGDYRDISHPQFYLLNRFFCVLLSAGCILLCYLIVKLLMPENPIAAVATVLMLSISYHHYEESRFVVPNVPMAFWTILTLYYCLKYNDSKKNLHLLIALAAAGTATATKLSGGVSLFFPAIVFLRNISLYRNLMIQKKIGGLLLLSTVPIIFFLLWTPSIFIDAPAWFRWNQWQVWDYSNPDTPQLKKEPGWEHFRFQFGLVVKELGIVLVCCAALGATAALIHLLRARSRADRIVNVLMLVAFPVFYFVYFTQKYIAYHRNFMVIYPFLAIWFGIFVAGIVNASESLMPSIVKPLENRKEWLRSGLWIILILVFVVMYSGRWREIVSRAQRQFHSADTRTKAIQWVNEWIDRNDQSKGIVGVAVELKVSSIDLRKLRVPYRLFPHDHIQDAFQENTILLVGEYESLHPKLHPGDARLNDKTSEFVTLQKIDGNRIFRDTIPPLSQTPHINPAVYILEGSSIESASKFPLSVAQTSNTVAMYSNSEHEFFDLNLETGRYEIIVAADGTPANREFPKLEILLGNSLLGSLFVKIDTAVYRVGFVLSRNQRAAIRIRFVNDFAKGGKDRNAFIRSVQLVRIKE